MPGAAAESDSCFLPRITCTHNPISSCWKCGSSFNSPCQPAPFLPRHEVKNAPACAACVSPVHWRTSERPRSWHFPSYIHTSSWQSSRGEAWGHAENKDHAEEIDHIKYSELHPEVTAKGGVTAFLSLRPIIYIIGRFPILVPIKKIIFFNILGSCCII